MRRTEKNSGRIRLGFLQLYLTEIEPFYVNRILRSFYPVHDFDGKICNIRIYLSKRNERQ